MSQTVSVNCCPVCSGNRLEAVYPSSRLLSCATCTHVFTQYVVDAGNRHFEGQVYRQWRQENQALLIKKALSRIGFLDPYLAGDSGRVFELGCGTGETLAVLQDRGWSAYGADLSTLSIEICKEIHPGINVESDLDAEILSDAVREGFDLVMGFHVVEHVPDLEELAARLAQWCRPGGLLCLFVPNWESWSRKLFGVDWPGIMPEHLHQFTPESMRHWLSRAGFRVEQLETKGMAWHWLGGLKRRLSGSRDLDVTEEKVGMPSHRAMQLLEAADVILQPFLWLEGRRTSGSEMRILARRDSSF